MSMHLKPMTPEEESGLRAHGLPVGTPSQLADAFRFGVAWADKARAEPRPDADGWIPWAGGKWQTIETAPKDKFVLLCGPSGYTTTPLVFTTGIMCSNYHAGRWIDHANDDLVDWGFEPTHWMPLPTPPES